MSSTPPPGPGGPSSSGIARRAFLRFAVATPAIASGACGSSTPQPPPTTGFLTDAERRALGALANVILPPDDLPGGEALGAVSYVERTLTAFDVSPPAIFAGGPYSGRSPFPNDDGTPSSNFPPNDFKNFVPLDRYADAAWRLTIFGSAGLMGGGPNDAVLGAVVGLRDKIRNGLAAAEKTAGQPLETLSLADATGIYKSLDSDFRDLVYSLVCEGAFSAPEYGGNKNFGGWKLAHFEGDVMPYGFSQYDPAEGVYRELANAPVSFPNPGPDPEPVNDDTWSFVRTVVSALGGQEFP